MKKPYNIGVTAGEFRMIHNGQINLISHAMCICDNFIVFVLNSDDTNEDNPIPFHVKKMCFEEIYKGNVGNRTFNIVPITKSELENIDTHQGVCDKIFDYTQKTYGIVPDLWASGNEPLKYQLFNPNNFENTTQLVVPRKQVDTRSTPCLDYLLRNDKDAWKSCVPTQLHQYYEWFRSFWIASTKNK